MIVITISDFFVKICFLFSKSLTYMYFNLLSSSLETQFELVHEMCMICFGLLPHSLCTPHQAVNVLIRVM